MTVTHLLLVVLALALFSGSVTEAGVVGVCYGMNARNLIKPPAVVQLLQSNGIKAVTLYDANAEALGALAGSGIEVGVSLPNDNLAAAAGSMSYAAQWVQNNVQAYYPNTHITSVAVGNEVFHQAPGLTSQLVPAMINIQQALANAGIADTVKVITPIALDALEASFPPSAGVFRADLAQSVMSPMIDFLATTGSYLSFNIYPYFAYMKNPQIDRNYVLFLPNSGQSDPGTGLHYDNMFDAMVDAVFHAVEKLRSSPAHTHTRGRKLDSTTDYITQSLKVKESGYSRGIYGLASSMTKASGLVGAQADATTDAQTYNSNLISKILRGGGTPYKPNADLSANIFSLFNEDLKPGDDAERNFGLFNPDGTPAYKVDFNPGGPSPAPGGASWCVANAAVGDSRLQAALDYACGHGADCSAIQPGKACYQPNTVLAHASYAFNSYYQSKARVSGSCDFAGAASVVYQKPATGCNAGSWCVANAGVGDSRLQAALDYACGHGADCSAIQNGGRCFNPNTKVAHASYAFNDYYHKNGLSDQSCDFGGCGSVVYQQPTFGNCVL
ncbi:unnamed protein product [Alopecurus aequalis]